ncbi:uncharacterized protein LOC115309197 [Ixodes scapularis]|uniref:uncharacterized protein LOC115309197 n=1 Tax=Ixodes scapularis TaxID=6945 RepID=UPI001A9F5A5A|nr:uncharacterized protein LOC115309197 [Ixodes scapularis]
MNVSATEGLRVIPTGLLRRITTDKPKLPKGMPSPFAGKALASAAEGAKRRASMKGDTIGDVFGVDAPEPEDDAEQFSGYEEDAAPYPDDQVDEQGDDRAPSAPPNEQRQESAEKLV